MHAIPLDIHSDLRPYIRSGMGSFWDYLCRDSDFIDSVVAARALDASQASIDIQEALSVRNHSSGPTFHREHWAPVMVRLDGRDMAPLLSFGMRGDPVIGVQPESSAMPGCTFTVGCNAIGSSVHTYAVEHPCPVSVETCLCDSVAAPTSILVPGDDFVIDRGVLVIRADKDPFESGTYRVFSDNEGVSRAVIWACDALYDEGFVSDFVGYPLGIDAPSTYRNRRLLSALWDMVTFGTTRRYMNMFLGAMYDVPTATGDETVVSVSSGEQSEVVTDLSVYSFPGEPAVSVGDKLKAGDFIAGDIEVTPLLSADTVRGLIDSGVLCRIDLPPGSIAGRDTGMVVTGAADELYPYIPAVQNSVLVTTTMSLPTDSCTCSAFSVMRSLIPAYSDLRVMQAVEFDHNACTVHDSDVRVGVHVAIDSGVAISDSHVDAYLVPSLP